MTYKNRIISLAMSLTVLVTFMVALTGCASSEKIPILKVEENVYIYDDDNVIDDDVEKKLNTMLVDLEEKTSVEFVIVSVKSLLNRSIEGYANNLFNTLGIGKKGKDNGVLLLFSRSDTRVRLEIGRGLEGLLTDSKCGRILDDYFVPYRENDEYTKATELTAKAVLSVIAKEYNIEIDGLDDAELPKEGESVPILVCLIIIFLVIVAIAISIYYVERKFSHEIHSSYDNDSFYGGDSSGGGFGGGFSGGGGASR